MHLKEENKVIIPNRLRWFNTKKPIKKLKFNIIIINIQHLTLTLWSFLMALIQ
jgi:hypothetical protein